MHRRRDRWFSASTDPGWYWIEHPMDPKGCAILTEATHLFKLGKQQGQYPALVQAEDFVVWRLDTDGKKRRRKGNVDIHIHSGGPRMNVGSFSAGCQVSNLRKGASRERGFNFSIR